MPELPEVEVLARHLDPLLRRRVIQRVRVFQPKVVLPNTPRQLSAALRGARFVHLVRRGKYLIFHLQSARHSPLAVLGHLGMTGRMYLLPRSAPRPPHAVVAMALGIHQFVFEDPRRFGRLTLDLRPLARLGPEPLEEDFTPALLHTRLAGSRQALKVRLMDQAVVAGVGNIYASECLWHAGLSPRRAAGRLSVAECQRLWRALRRTLREAIRQGSTMPLDFTGAAERDRLFYYGRAADTPDGYTERLRVYDRAGQPCPRCGGVIRRLTQAARSTYWCPACQSARD